MNEDLTATYQHLDQLGVRALTMRRLKPDTVPVSGEPRWGLSAVIRLHGSTAQELAILASQLPITNSIRGIVYSAGTLHVTVRSLECYRDEVAPNDEVLHNYISALDEVGRQIYPFRLQFSGVSLTPGGVVAAGYPDSDALFRLRHELITALHKRCVAGPPEGSKPRQTAHASLAVYRTSEIDTAKLLVWRKKFYDWRSSAQSVRCIELVQYRFVPALDVVTLHKSYLSDPHT